MAFPSVAVDYPRMGGTDDASRIAANAHLKIDSKGARKDTAQTGNKKALKAINVLTIPMLRGKAA